MVEGEALLDLDYSEDSTAEVDANVVMTGDGGLVEVQATAERTPLSRASLDELLALAADGMRHLQALQQQTIAGGRRGGRAGVARPAARAVVKLLLATHNEHKRREFQRLLAGTELQIDMLSEAFELPPEDGDTFAENALGKARAAAEGEGRASIADDSGICAAALAGAPGVRSARFAGEQATDQENLDLLLERAPAGSGLSTCA